MTRPATPRPGLVLGRTETDSSGAFSVSLGASHERVIVLVADRDHSPSAARVAVAPVA